VGKTRARGRVGAVAPHVVFGDAHRLGALWAPLPPRALRQTSFVAREHGALRPHHRRLTRKPQAFSQELPWLATQRWVALAYPPVVLPPDRLGQARMPAMAAGLPDQGWTTDEVLSYRVPAPVVDQLDPWAHLCPQPEPIDQGN
jgi:hypothetical protein